MAAGAKIVPVLALILPAAVLRLEAKLSIESEVDSGLERLAADSAASELRATIGAG
jgi:hypothetical protein